MQRGVGAIAMAVLAVAGCDQARPPTEAAAPAAEAPLPVATPVADLEAFSGRPYADFAAAHAERFNHQALGLSAEDGARVDRVMGGAPGVLLQGGGAEALVFRGCAEGGCADGLGVVAIDAATGAVFVGLREGAGEDILVPNDRLEALLRLNAPTRDWADVTPSQAPQTTRAAATQP